LPGYTPLELMDLDFDSGYVTIRNAQTLEKPRSISHEEGVALILGLDLISSVISPERTDLKSQIESLRLRISQVVNLPSSLSVTSQVNQKIHAEIRSALSTKSGVAIEYHAIYRDEITSRTVYPLEIIQKSGNSYLHAFCFSANDFRFFRLDRISSATLTEVERPKEASSETKKSISFIAKVLKLKRDTAERFQISNVTVGMQFESTSYSEEWLERSILASGDCLELISPIHIRERISARAQSTLNYYL
jgi:proteasome accessory factor C